MDENYKTGWPHSKTGTCCIATLHKTEPDLTKQLNIRHQRAFSSRLMMIMIASDALPSAILNSAVARNKFYGGKN